MSSVSSVALEQGAQGVHLTAHMSARCNSHLAFHLTPDLNRSSVNVATPPHELGMRFVTICTMLVLALALLLSVAGCDTLARTEFLTSTLPSEDWRSHHFYLPERLPEKHYPTYLFSAVRQDYPTYLIDAKREVHRKSEPGKILMDMEQGRGRPVLLSSDGNRDGNRGCQRQDQRL